MIEMCILCFLLLLMLNIDFYEFFIVNRQFNLLGEKTLNGLNKRDYKQHHKDCNDLRKELINYIDDKDFGPWDNYTLYFLEVQIKYWIKYYSLGWNVWGQEERDAIKEGYFPIPKDGVLPPTRLEIAKTLQILLYRYNDFLFGLTDAELLEYESNHNAFPNSLLQNRMRDFRNKYDYVDNEGNLHYDDVQMSKDYEKCKKELFDYYYKYSIYMWD